MSQALIRKAFETRLQTWATANGIEVAWQNVQFEPTVGSAYACVDLLPAKTNELFLDQTGRDYRGIIQVSLYMPAGTGAAAAEALVTSLDSSIAGSFTDGPIQVTLTAPLCAAPALAAADWYMVPVSGTYRVVTSP